MLGILVSSVGENPYLMYVLNQLQTNRVCFYEYIIPFRNVYNFPILSISEAYSFKGSLLATNLSTASKLVNFAVEQEKLYYVRSCEWGRVPNKVYEQLSRIYQNENIKLIAANQDIADFLFSLWGRHSVVVPERKLQDYLEQYESNSVNL